MKKGMMLLLVSMLLMACATPEKSGSNAKSSTQKSQINDEETWRVGPKITDTDVSCTRCGLAERKKELEEITKEIMRQAQ